jgi:AAA+ superfamily predicted ATPase
MSDNENSTGIFQDVRVFPDSDAMKRFDSLRGLDDVKERLLKEAHILLSPKALQDWSKKYHKKKLPIISSFLDRPPLFIFGGDVGTGKTALAESVGDPIARKMDIPITLYELSLNARGSGAVGEMTKLISKAFDEVAQTTQPIASGSKNPTGATILLIDEADALAQSRESDQMHHEDRAGVNALIRGIDQLCTQRLPVIVFMCTNRLDAIDPAVRRRAADTFSFERPGVQERRSMLETSLDGIGLKPKELDVLAELTGPAEERSYGLTYSDIAQRLVPNLLLDAFPDSAITYQQAILVAESIKPTPPFTKGCRDYEHDK